MQTIEILCRLLPALWVIWAFSIIAKMPSKKEDIDMVLDEGATKYRYFFETLFFALLVWYIVYPQSRPEIFIIAFPSWLKILGLVVMIIGMFLRVWAQLTLGEMWSPKIRRVKNHRLVKDGPYRYISHPMYVAYVLIAPGTFAVSGDWLLGIAGGIYAILSLARIPQENWVLRK